MIRIRVFEEHDALHEAAARIVLELVAQRPAAVLGVATGSSPLGLYRRLAASVDSGDADLTRTSAFALDEYVGLDADDPRGYRQVIRDAVTVPLRLRPAAVSVPDGSADDPHAAAADYEDRVVRAGVDLQILGIGRNGHIGFNEPGSDPDSVTRLVPLAPETRQDNARFFEDLRDVPTHAITQGIGTILRARTVLLLATGAAKADALAASLTGAIDPVVPASALQRHDEVIVLADSAAAARLPDPIRR